MRKQLIALAFISAISSPILCDKNATAGSVQLPQTGQTICRDSTGTTIACAGTGQDGDITAGVAWPNPRFTPSNNGTVTDNLTGLVWLINANCFDTVGGISKSSGGLVFTDALQWSNALADGKCGLTDGSIPGDWRLPNFNEIESLIDLSQFRPALPPNNFFTNVPTSYVQYQPTNYWTSSTRGGRDGWICELGIDGAFNYWERNRSGLVLPVRDSK